MVRGSLVNMGEIRQSLGEPNMKRCLIAVIAFALSPWPAKCAEPGTNFVEHITALMDGRTEVPVKLEGSQAAVTKAHFKPPVEIEIVAKTDSTNLRMSYAADEVIFNWEGDPEQLRIDGGPASGKHERNAGEIPTKRYVTIRWLVTPTKQTIRVNDRLRFSHSGDYSQIDRPVRVFPAVGSKVTVKSIRVRHPPPGAK